MAEQYKLPKNPQKYNDSAEFDSWVAECFQIITAAEGKATAEAWMKEQYRERKKAKDKDSRRENRNFTQVYPAGWQRLQMLMKANASAARLYAFFAENMGTEGAVCVSRSTLAEALDNTERTISRHVKYLEEVGALVVLKVGSANVYCLKPEEVWKSFDNNKTYAPFNTRTLVGKGENPFVKRRLATLLGGQAPEQKDWLDDIDEDVDASIKVAAE